MNANPSPEVHTTPRPLLHGLSIITPENEADALNDRIDFWTSSLKPFDIYEAWLVHEVARNTLEIERLHQTQIVLRHDHAQRIAIVFEQQQRDHAELLASGLARHPARALAALRKFAQGCLVIARRWEWLLKSLDKRGNWTESQRQQAMNLLNVPPDLRDGVTPLDPPDEDPETLREHLQRVAETELQRHKELAALLQPLDERMKHAQSLGLGPEPPEVAAIRKVQRQAERRLAWTRSQFKTSRPDPRPVDRNNLPAYIPGEWKNNIPYQPNRTSSAEPPTPREPQPPAVASTPSWSTPQPSPDGPALNVHPNPKPQIPDPTPSRSKHRRRRA